MKYAVKRGGVHRGMILEVGAASMNGPFQKSASAAACREIFRRRARAASAKRGAREWRATAERGALRAERAKSPHCCLRVKLDFNSTRLLRAMAKSATQMGSCVERPSASKINIAPRVRLA